MLIRPLQPADAQSASELVCTGFRAHVAHEWEPAAAQEFLDLELAPERMAQLITESAFTAGAFGEAGDLLGVVILPQPDWLAVLFVHPRAFRRGVGRQLWERTREFVASLSPPVPEVRLNASSFAIGFYLKLGFVPRESIEKRGRRGTRMVWQVPPQERDMQSMKEKADAFRQLHAAGSCFVIPNPWDLGSARLLEHLGFKALASTSAGFAFSQGRSDLSIAKSSLMTHLTALSQATSLPISADLQNGFGNDPEDVVVTVLQAARSGAVGGSIEDAVGDGSLYPLELAAERIRNAALALKSLDFRFTLTARAENYLYGRQDLGETIRRLQAFQEAGADVLFAPGIKSREELRQVVKSIDRPLNVLAGMPGMNLSVADLQELGVTRISVGGTLARTAYSAMLEAAREISTAGTFGYSGRAVSNKELNSIFANPAP